MKPLHQPVCTLLVLLLALGACAARELHDVDADATAMQARGFLEFLEDFLKDPVEYLDTALKVSKAGCAAAVVGVRRW